MAVLWLFLVTLACLIPAGIVRDVEPVFKISDKLAHGFFYFVNTILCFLYFYKPGLKGILLKVSLFSFVYGIIIEVLQLMLPFGRSAEMNDVLANGTGILTAILLIRFGLLKRMNN
jgi:VanZ family protein